MKKFMAVLALIALTAFAAPVFAAENPFTDVPAGHWAYDAVAQLASRGVVSGYPDGSYKGAQPMTRYEMASMIARTLAHVDMEKASKQDMELLKKLVMEFKNELDALGVNVSDLDKRVAVLEDGVGGWKIRGIFMFDAKFGNSDTGAYQYNQRTYRENEFDKERFRLFLTKTIDENTYFYAQYRAGGIGDLGGAVWSHLYVDTKLPYDIGFRVGRFAVDFEGSYGLYGDNDALFGDFRLDGFQMTKDFGMLNATAIIGRNFTALGHESFGPSAVDYAKTSDHMAYILDLHLQPSERFFIGATGYWGNEDNDTTGFDSDTYALYAGYSFTPAVALKGVYYWQNNDDDFFGDNIDDSPNAWKAILDVKQEALKFTSLWVEYSQIDNAFLTAAYPRYSIGDTDAHVTANRPLNNETTKVWFVKAAQKWSDKWNTWLRFARADFDTANVDDATEWGIGIGYQYTPAIHFELGYDQVDYGTGSQLYQDKESVFRFRTTVNF